MRHLPVVDGAPPPSRLPIRPLQSRPPVVLRGEGWERSGARKWLLRLHVIRCALALVCPLEIRPAVVLRGGWRVMSGVRRWMQLLPSLLPSNGATAAASGAVAPLTPQCWKPGAARPSVVTAAAPVGMSSIPTRAPVGSGRWSGMLQGMLVAARRRQSKEAFEVPEEARVAMAQTVAGFLA